MRILHTNFHRGWGGQSNRILTECRGLHHLGHEVVLAVPEGSELQKRALEAGLEVFSDVRFARGLRLQHLMHDARALRGLIRRRDFHIVHTHGSQDSWAVAAALANFRPRPIVLRTKHNVFPVSDHLFNRMLYGRWTDGIVCISNSILDYCAAKPYLRRENLSLVHSAIDLERFAAAREDASLRGTLGISDRYVAGITGRLREEKGHRHIIAALPQIVAEAPDFLLLIVGAGSLEGEFRQIVESLGMQAHVRFTGFREDIPQVLGALDLFVMPSISEGLGTAILEAAAAERPIVATDVGGIPDIISHGKSGLLVPPGNPQALAQAVLQMYRDRAFARQCATAARAHVERVFGEQALVEKTERVYQEWLARGRSRS